MRRNSDHSEGERTGTGRRARDRILSGGTLPSPVITARHELANLVLFLSDDLRAIVDDRRVVERFDLLADALASLRKSMARIHDSLESTTQ